MDLAHRKPLETMCHTLHLNTPFKSYINQAFMAAILDFRFLCISCKSFARLYTQVVFVGICRDDFHRPTFTARHVPKTPWAPWVCRSHRLPTILNLYEWAGKKHIGRDPVMVRVN